MLHHMPTLFRIHNLSLTLVILLLSLQLSACGGRSPETRLYILTPTLQAQNQPTSATGPRVAVGPVSLPAYLDKSAIITRNPSSTQLDVAAFDHWAEALDEGVARVVAGHLAAQLESTGAMVFIQRSMLDSDWRLALNINRFDATFNGELLLEANWSLVHTARGSIREERSVLSVPTGSSVDSVVAAHGQALALLAEQIGKTLQQELAAQTETERPRRSSRAHPRN